MAKKILERYARSADNKIIIDITADRVEDLYNDLDKHAPYRRKELDQDLVDYIIDSASEIGKKQFVLQFRLATLPDTKLTSRIKISIRNYFEYLIALEHRELAKMTRSSAILFTIGVIILFLSVGINEKVAGQETAITDVFAEGLNIAAWVSLWNAMAHFIIDWAPRRQLIKMYDRISAAAILFDQDTPHRH